MDARIKRYITISCIFVAWNIFGYTVIKNYVANMDNIEQRKQEMISRLVKQGYNVNLVTVKGLTVVNKEMIRPDNTSTDEENTLPDDTSSEDTGVQDTY